MTKNTLITQGFKRQAFSLPDNTKAFLATRPTLEEINNEIGKGAAMLEYAKRLEVAKEDAIAITRPVALAVLQLKAGLGTLMPAKPPNDRQQGRGGKKSNGAPPVDLDSHTMSAYRKIAKSNDRLDDYYEDEQDVPTQTGFLKWVANGGVLVNKMTGNNERYTPSKYIESARIAMGSIDVDPASNSHAQETIRAKTFYTKDNCGLSQPWEGNVWLNPPYEKGLVDKFVSKLLEEIEAEIATQAVVLTNNSTDSGWFQKMFMEATAVSLPKKRIQFYDQDDETTSPTNGQTFFYFGAQPCKFREEFMKYGPGCLGQW